MALRIYERGCDEANVMIFPVFDYFEVKDWLVDFVKYECKQGFGELQYVRNQVFLGKKEKLVLLYLGSFGRN